MSLHCATISSGIASSWSIWSSSGTTSERMKVRTEVRTSARSSACTDRLLLVGSAGCRGGGADDAGRTQPRESGGVEPQLGQDGVGLLAQGRYGAHGEGTARHHRRREQRGERTDGGVDGLPPV